MQHGAIARYQKIQLLDHIQEYFVLPVLNALRTPRDSIRQCLRRARRTLQAIAFLRHAPKTIKKKWIGYLKAIGYNALVMGKFLVSIIQNYKVAIYSTYSRNIFDSQV